MYKKVQNVNKIHLTRSMASYMSELYQTKLKNTLTDIRHVGMKVLFNIFVYDWILNICPFPTILYQKKHYETFITNLTNINKKTKL